MSNNDLDDFRPTRQGFGFALGWAAVILVFIFLVGMMAGGMNFIGSWLSQPAKIYSPENVREQWRFAYDYDASLKAIAIQVCNAEKVLETAPDSDKSQRQTQLIARQDNYARVAAEYNGRLRDAFRAGLVKPSDVPNQAASLEDTKRQSCSG